MYHGERFNGFSHLAAYHSTRGRTKRILLKLDHCANYLLIAGTDTPFTLVTLRDACMERLKAWAALPPAHCPNAALFEGARLDQSFLTNASRSAGRMPTA